MKVQLDPQLSAPGSGLNGEAMTRATISLRWENLTARQALDAILENYGLELVDDPKGSDIKTVSKAKSSTRR